MNQADDTADAIDPPRRSLPPIFTLVLGAIAIVTLTYAVFSQRWLYAKATQLQYSQTEDLVSTLGDVHERAFGLRTTSSCPSNDDDPCEDMTNAALLASWRQHELTARFMLHEHVDAELADTESDMAQLTRQREALDSPDSSDHDYIVRQEVTAKHVYASSGVFPTFGWITLICLAIAILSLAVACGFVLAGKRVMLPVMPTTTALLGLGIGLIAGCIFVATKPGPAGYVGVGLGFFAFGAGIVVGLYAAIQLARLMRPHDPDLLEDSLDPDSF